MSWTLDDVPEDPEASAWRSVGDSSKVRVELWASTVARLLASKRTPPLVRAIVARDAAALAGHLDEASRRDAVGPEEDPMTPLHYAVMADDPAAVEALLAAGASPDEATGAERVPLVLEAIAHASRPVLARLLAVCNLAVTSPRPPHLSVLGRVKRGDLVEVLDDLVARGVDCTALHPTGSLLHHGARLGRLDVVRWCLARGMPPDLRCPPTRKTPLYEAATSRAADVVLELLQRGADVHATCFRSQVSALHAVASPSVTLDDDAALERTIDCLLAHGLGVDVRDERGQTPLHHACRFDDVRAARILLARGASREVRDVEGHTPAELVHEGDALGRTAALRALMH